MSWLSDLESVETWGLDPSSPEPETVEVERTALLAHLRQVAAGGYIKAVVFQPDISASAVGEDGALELSAPPFRDERLFCRRLRVRKLDDFVEAVEIDTDAETIRLRRNPASQQLVVETDDLNTRVPLQTRSRAPSQLPSRNALEEWWARREAESVEIAKAEVGGLFQHLSDAVDTVIPKWKAVWFVNHGGRPPTWIAKPYNSVTTLDLHTGRIRTVGKAVPPDRDPLDPPITWALEKPKVVAELERSVPGVGDLVDVTVTIPEGALTGVLETLLGHDRSPVRMAFNRATSTLAFAHNGYLYRLQCDEVSARNS